MAFRRLTLIIGLLALLDGCDEIHGVSLSPNDPDYWYDGAPRDRSTSVRAPGNERIYRSLGGTSY